VIGVSLYLNRKNKNLKMANEASGLDVEKEHRMCTHLSPSPWVRCTPSMLKLVGEQSKAGKMVIRSGRFWNEAAKAAVTRAKLELYQYGWHLRRGGSTKI